MPAKPAPLRALHHRHATAPAGVIDVRLISALNAPAPEVATAPAAPLALRVHAPVPALHDL